MSAEVIPFAPEEDDDEELGKGYDLDFDDEEEEGKGIGSITFIAVYASPYWDILEFSGEGRSLIEWSESKDLNDIVALGGSTWNARSQLEDALTAEYPLIDGMMVFCKASVEYTVSHGFDGTEYDMNWNIEAWAVTYPNGNQSKIDNALRVAEDFVAAGGTCPKCYTKLKGQTLAAKKFGECDRCAKRDWDTMIATINDPLYPLRVKALAAIDAVEVNHAYGNARINGPAARKDVGEATEAEQLDKIIDQANQIMRRDLEFDRLFW